MSQLRINKDELKRIRRVNRNKKLKLHRVVILDNNQIDLALPGEIPNAIYVSINGSLSKGMKVSC